MSDERQDTAESSTEESAMKDVVVQPSKKFLDPDKVSFSMGAVNTSRQRAMPDTQADEVAQVEFQKKYGPMKKPVTPRKISSVSDS